MKQFSLQAISSFCMSVHLAMRAGIPAAEGVDMFREEETDTAAKEALSSVFEDMSLGEQMSVSLRKTGAFPDYMTDMIEVGEKTGKLDNTLLSLSRYYDRQITISKSIRGAVTYPLMLLCVLVLVLIIFIIKILPIFSDVYSQLGAEMSGVAAAALSLGDTLREGWIYIAAAFIIIAALCVIFRRRAKSLLSKLFMRGRLRAGMTAARFSSVLSMTLAAGMDYGEALEMSRKLTDDKTVKEKIDTAIASSLQGAGFAAVVADTGILPSLYNRMISIGEKTGSGDTVMEEIASRTGDEASARLDSFIGKIEPALVIIMSVLIGILLLSIMLPLAGIMNAI